MAKNTPAPGTKHTLQNMGNWSFDEDFNVNAVVLLGYDADNNVLRRVLVDSTGALITTTIPGNKILLENGDIMLAENGNYLILEQ